MKLLNIKFKNIHSLKGEHEVRFDTAPLANSGIFAITGATGSGKSSILDVITLALYNEIPRFDRKISKTEIHRMGSVVTHYTAEAWAEVTYETKVGQFRSRWEISKTRTGSWRDYNMTITDLTTDRIMDVKKSEVPSKNEILIGLNYDQFVKSIILSQGEFARFLKSPKNARTELLQEITGTHIYKEIGIQTYELLKEKKQELEIAQAKLDNITTLSAEEKQEVVIEQKKLKFELENCKKKVASTNLGKKAKLLQLEILTEKEDIKKERIHAEQRKTAFEKDQLRLATHLALIPHAPDMQSLREAEHTMSHELDHHEHHKNECLKNEGELQNSIAEMSQFTGKEITEDNFMQKMAQFEKSVLAFDNQLEQLLAKGRDSRLRIKGKIDNAKFKICERLNRRKQPAEDLTLITERLNDLGPTRDFNSKEKRSKQKILNEELQALKEWQRFLLQKVELDEKVKQVINSQLEKKKLLDIGGNRRTQIEKNLDSTNQVLMRKEKEYHKALSEASLEEQRHDLKDGEPCPLCGSREHPYSLHMAYSDAGKVTVELHKMKDEKTRLEAELNKANSNIAVTSTNIENLKESKMEIELDLKNQLKNCADFSKVNPFLIEYNLITIIPAQRHRSSELEIIDNLFQSQEEASFLLELRMEYEILDVTVKDFKALDGTRKKLYEGRDVSRDADIIQNSFRGAQSSIIKEKALLEKIPETYSTT